MKLRIHFSKEFYRNKRSFVLLSNIFMPIILILGLAFCQKRIYNSKSTPKIFGGQTVENSEKLDFQHVAAMVSISPEGVQQHHCTVVVVGPYQGLTAAHCVAAAKSAMRFDPIVFKIGFPSQENKTITVDNRDLRKITNMGQHRDFEMTGSNINAKVKSDAEIEEVSFVGADVAYVEWVGDLPPHIRPVSLIDKISLKEGDPVTLVGFGRTTSDGELDGILRKVDTKVRALWTKTSDVVVVGEFGVRGACTGDSGGPLFVKQNGQYILVGLTSYGVIGNKCEGGLTAYTEVPRYKNFFSTMMRFDFDSKKKQEPERPQGTFSSWCEQNKAATGALGNSRTALLNLAGTKDCEEANSYLSRITFVDLEGKGVSDLTGLATLNQLGRISLVGSSINSFAALKHFPFLSFLAVSESSVTSLESLMLSAFPMLDSVDFSKNQIKDDSPLEKFLTLKHVDLSENPIQKKGCPWNRTVNCQGF